MGELDPYVRAWLEQGYAPAQVREWLLSQGYASEEVDAALAAAAERPAGAPGLALAAAALAVVTLAALAFLYVRGTGQAVGEVRAPAEPLANGTGPVQEPRAEPAGTSPSPAPSPSQAASPSASASRSAAAVAECQARPVLNERTACLRLLANRTGDLAVCDAVEDQEDATDCRAYAARDIAICARIATAAKRERCMTSLVAGVTDPEVCRAVTEAGPRDQCLMSAAGARRDAAICEEMSEHSYYKAQCVASAGGRAAQATPQASPQASPKAVT